MNPFFQTCFISSSGSAIPPAFLLFSNLLALSSVNRLLHNIKLNHYQQYETYLS